MFALLLGWAGLLPASYPFPSGALLFGVYAALSASGLYEAVKNVRKAVGVGMRFLLAAALAALIGVASSSLAAGRAACRVEYPWRAACFAEEGVVQWGPLEVVAGLEARYPGGSSRMWGPSSWAKGSGLVF
ncbi:hypothetical protein [Thermus antranikianii]|uniref:hypothetical protein n=1 Tax=Thermus antranikianii TaxID=88190 RepID=UPI001C746971|nr:hypothetical protein [Thermus antranikianii]QWK20805.1 MAG: hypothetical protein KNN15_06945 [Thermus antranikianii]